MQQNNYRDVYAKTLLNEIKSRIRQNRMKLFGEKEQETDIKMLEVIKDLCVKSKSELDNQNEYILKVLPSSSEEETERIICTLMLYYAALYNDNVSLLNELLEKGYRFGNKRYELKLFALDKRISSQFNKDLYFDLLDNQSLLFHTFYYSLNDSSIDVTDEESINSFCSILNKDPKVAFSEEKNFSGENTIHNLLTKGTLAYFGEEIILNATEKQKRNIISWISFSKLSSDEIIRIINLMRYHDFSLRLFYSPKEILKEFTDDELIRINGYEENLFYKYYSFETGEIDFDKIRKEIKVVPIQVQEVKKRNAKKKLLNLFRNNK